MSLIWFILLAVIFHYLLTRTRFGNWIQATGGNPGAARNRGVPTQRVKIILFMLSAAMAAFAGIISSIRVSAANPNSGTGYELEVIAMVVIGGTVLTGGRGTIIGTVLGRADPAADAQRHRADRRSGPCLQYLHRRDHSGDDGAACRA